ncbi:MAG: PaaX family transcriptional regulator [Meiothermus sp.]|uniref:PaaX family transcriptional regulator n=1 Tax=Meiothermus sp. TaxID=1955249 RepID=UPI0025F635BA|nr:PaaX family transcriptional regulator C-terminal domain-containing protein [Meiothermus sp.]MCS7058933.1 PaaX family transcriptional regulator [Meiothermus sp.]MCS7194691.1 PaaX family transcriptional regulator [Meiothermus sp.]MCX7739724.1 PaaX family transcriptional regulator [Meiothermus sp.]MDW8090532.1 PaaX family transcriptional regulator C-terminal domain-containing protein [Meiothermus sp.]MDW8482181.1 PaaX family transcriptional regulator C-terminal domain-containing protein [Meiot
MRARSYLFTLYMEYLYPENRAWVGDLIRWMQLLRFSEPAVRAAVSRSVKRGWIIPEKEGRRAYYRLSPRVAWQVERVRERLYGYGGPWDGRWRILVYAVPEAKRTVRDRFRNELILLGFGTPAPGVWISPNASLEAARDLVGFYGLQNYVELFQAERFSATPSAGLVEKAFNLREAQARYQAFLAQPLARPKTPEEAFARLTHLIHQARKNLFLDPGLPPELTPPGFLGQQAKERFLELRGQLAQQARPLFPVRVVAAD